MARALILKKPQYNLEIRSANSYRRNAPAFTMIEIIVSLAILSTSMLAVFGVLRVCLAANGQSMMLTKSVLLAESLLTETSLQKPVSYQTTQGNDGLFSWQVQVAPTENDNLAAVCIQINWKQQERQRQYELLSLLYIQPQLEGK